MAASTFVMSASPSRISCLNCGSSAGAWVLRGPGWRVSGGGLCPTALFAGDLKDPSRVLYLIFQGAAAQAIANRCRYGLLDLSQDVLLLEVGATKGVKQRANPSGADTADASGKWGKRTQKYDSSGKGRGHRR
jgi:hypothetical protein